MPDVSAIPIVGTVVDTVSGLVGGNEADDQVQQATQKADQTQWKMYQQMREDLGPYRSGGENLWGQYQNALQGGAMTPEQAELKNYLQNYIQKGGPQYGVQAPQFSFAGIQDPSIAYVQGEAQKAAERSAAARQGALSGSAVTAAQKQAANIGSTYWQNAYQNALSKYGGDIQKYGADISGYNAQQNAYGNQAQLLSNLFNTGQNVQNNYLQQLMEGSRLGQNSAAVTGAAGQYTGNALANNALLSGVSGANQAVSAANTISGGANNLLKGIGNLYESNKATQTPTNTTSYYEPGNWGYNQFGGGF